VVYNFHAVYLLMSKTTQKLDQVTLERFRKHGKMGDSFDKVANRVLDKAESNNSEEVDEDEGERD